MSSCLLVTWPLAAAYNESGLICLSSDVGCSRMLLSNYRDTSILYSQKLELSGEKANVSLMRNMKELERSETKSAPQR